MKRTYNILLLLLMAISCFAQQLEVVLPLTHAGSVGAASVPSDNNGNPCAKIIVEIPLDGVEFDGMYLQGNTIKRTTGQYEMFVSIPKSEGKTITLSHQQYPSVEIPLWCDGAPLSPLQAYSVKISLPKVMTEYEEFVVLKKMEFTDLLDDMIDDFQKYGKLTYDFMRKRGFKDDRYKNDWEDYTRHVFEDVPIYFNGESPVSWEMIINEQNQTRFETEIGSVEIPFSSSKFTPLKYKGGSPSWKGFLTYKYKSLYIVIEKFCGASNCWQKIYVCKDENIFHKIINELKGWYDF